jgi:hypothetical protein
MWEIQGAPRYQRLHHSAWETYGRALVERVEKVERQRARIRGIDRTPDVSAARPVRVCGTLSLSVSLIAAIQEAGLAGLLCRKELGRPSLED